MRKIIFTLFIALGVFSTIKAQQCNGSLSVTIEGASTNEVLEAKEEHDHLSCNSASGAADGAINLTVEGGSPDYTFNWATADGGGIVAGAEDQSALEAGTYSVTISDKNGCEVIIGPVTLKEPDPVKVDGTLTHLDCKGVGSGAIDITAGGGTAGASPAYTYAWATADGDGLDATAEDQTELSAGTYSVTVTDGNDCTITASFTITEPEDVLSCDATSPVVGNGGTNILCNGGTGSITVSGDGGTGPYEYSLDGGVFQSAGSFADVSAGAHTVTVKDANGCTSTCDITLTEPTPLVAGSCNYVQDLCQLGNGEIKIEASGGVAPYEVTYTVVPVAPNTVAGDLDQVSGQEIENAGESVTFTGADGNNQYNFVVTDANGCQVP